MDKFIQLNNFVRKILEFCEEKSIHYEIISYSPKIGHYEHIEKLGWFNIQNKHIIVFPESAYDHLKNIFRKSNFPIRKNEDFLQKGNVYGIDIYQSVEYFEFDCQLAKSSKQFNLENLKINRNSLIHFQKQFNKKNPKIFPDFDIYELIKALYDAEKYLEEFNDETKKISISRLSGVSHKIRLSPNTKMKRVSYRSIAFIFSKEDKFPEHNIDTFKKIYDPNKRFRSDSITAQYYNDPHLFNFYRKVGIYEFFDKKEPDLTLPIFFK